MRFGWIDWMSFKMVTFLQFLNRKQMKRVWPVVQRHISLMHSNISLFHLKRNEVLTPTSATQPDPVLKKMFLRLRTLSGSLHVLSLWNFQHGGSEWMNYVMWCQHHLLSQQTCKKNVLQHKLAHNRLDVVLVGEVRACVCVFVVISL